MATMTGDDLDGEDPESQPSSDFDQFYAKTFPRLVGYAIVQGLSRHDAVDVAQKAMMGAYKAWLGRRQLSLCPYKDQEAYVIRSMRNEMTDRWRSQGRLRRALSNLWNQQKQSYVQWDDEDRTPALDLLQKLPRMQREVVVRVADGWTMAQVAEHLGVSTSTARTHLQLARAKLQEGLKAEGTSTYGE